MQERALREERSTGEVLSDLARQATHGLHRHPDGPGAERHASRPLPHRGAAVSDALIDQLRDDEPE